MSTRLRLLFWLNCNYGKCFWGLVSFLFSHTHIYLAKTPLFLQEGYAGECGCLAQISFGLAECCVGRYGCHTAACLFVLAHRSLTCMYFSFHILPCYAAGLCSEVYVLAKLLSFLLFCGRPQCCIRRIACLWQEGGRGASHLSRSCLRQEELVQTF